MFINPFEIVDVNYSHNCAIFNKWDDISDLNIDILLYVRVGLPMFNKENAPRTYSFEPDSKLKGVCFINDDYTIRLINNGDKPLSFDIYLVDNLKNFFYPKDFEYDKDNYYFKYKNYENEYEFSKCRDKRKGLCFDKSEYSFDNSPFVYYIDKTGSKYILGIMIPLFVIFNGAFIFYMIIEGGFN